jgi:hypothetical protein
MKSLPQYLPGKAAWLFRSSLPVSIMLKAFSLLKTDVMKVF